MSLKIDPLTKDDEFFNGASTSAALVGGGQMVYFQNCTIKVYKTGQEQKPVEVIEEACDGQALLTRGISVLLEGGRVVEV